MDGVEGKECKGCHQKKVYLVEEKQTRCADEPTTKFFECFNCGDKFRI
jgi:transcription elongation factor S-II